MSMCSCDAFGEDLWATVGREIGSVYCRIQCLKMQNQAKEFLNVNLRVFYPM